MLRGTLILAIATAGVVHAQPNPTCVATCDSGAYPECPRCDEYNVCSELEGAADDAGRARVTAGHEEAWACGEARVAGGRAFDVCAAGADRAGCCASACARHLRPAHGPAAAWLLADTAFAPVLRVAGDDVE